jgi:hypothetical protein
MKMVRFLVTVLAIWKVSYVTTEGTNDNRAENSEAARKEVVLSTHPVQM